MNILIIGSGGREHALVWKISQSPHSRHLYVAPGNPGTEALAKNLPIDPTDFQALASACKEKAVDIIVVGPEAPLVGGFRDFIESDPKLKHVTIIGPGQKGAQLEGSKDFAKRFMKRHHIPTATSMSFNRTQIQEAYHYAGTQPLPLVIKADGLAAGKGVIIATSPQEVYNTIRMILEEKKFGDAGSQILIESYLDGLELSVFLLTDHHGHYVLLPEAKDYKRIGEHNVGPNTGGMGTVSPVPFVDPPFLDRIEQQIIKPTLSGLQQDNILYEGFLFIGIMKVGQEPYVLEYNVRLGDPEAQSILSRLNTDLVDLFIALRSGKLNACPIQYDPRTSLTVMMSTKNYPNDYPTGKVISGLQTLQKTRAFHSGTKRVNDQLLTHGGRVLGLTALGDSIDQARQMVYSEIQNVSWEGAYFRSDIGLDMCSFESLNSTD